jgi:hypothetical protein
LRADDLTIVVWNSLSRWIALSIIIRRPEAIFDEYLKNSYAVSFRSWLGIGA